MFGTTEHASVGQTFSKTSLRRRTDGDLCDAAIELEALISELANASAHVLAELDARGVCDRDHGMRTPAWLAHAAHTSRPPIAQRLRVGRALRTRFDEIDAAVCDGTLSFEHARALVNVDNPRITDALAAAQKQIIALAEGTTFDQWKADVAALAEHADADGPTPEPHRDNRLRLSRTLGGTFDLVGAFDAENGLILRTALASKADELFRRFTRDHEATPELEVPGRSTLQALALTELLRIAAGADPSSAVAPRAEVTIVTHNHAATDTDGHPLPRAAADVWGCDPEIWAVIVDHLGNPVDVGHTRRLATVAQRRAITVRDGGCTFPGCDAPITWCDLHHVTPWQHGGPTDQANLVALCRHHHGVTHRTGWHLELDEHQIPHWATPTGRTLVGQRHRRQPTSDGQRLVTPPSRCHAHTPRTARPPDTAPV